MESCDVDIYVTGSNSKLMSGEISTYLTGRYISIPVYTLSLREYIDFKKKTCPTQETFLTSISNMAAFPLSE